MPRRRKFGSVVRRRRRRKGAPGPPADEYFPGWYIRYRRDGREVTRHAGPDRLDAEVFLARLQARVKRGDPDAHLREVRFDAYARQYLRYSRREHTPSTARARRSEIKARLLPFFRDTRLADITLRDIERLLTKMEHASPGTRNRTLSALSAMFQRAIELGHARTNPAGACRRSREHVAPLPLVSPEDQVRLINALPADRRALFLTALDTGARIGELLGLRWRDIEFETGSILVRKSKNYRPRIVRMSRRVRAALRQWKLGGVPGDAKVFESAADSKDRLRTTWRKVFKRAAASIGHPRLRVHDLRHLTAINLVRAGIDLPTIQAHLGHKHLVSTLRYAAYADRSASDRAAKALDKLFGSLEEPPPNPDPRGGGV